MHSRTGRRSALTCSAVRTHVGSLVVSKGTKFAIVVARFNDLVTKLLLDGAVEALKRHGADEVDIEVYSVVRVLTVPEGVQACFACVSFIITIGPHKQTTGGVGSWKLRAACGRQDNGTDGQVWGRDHIGCRGM